MLHIITMKILHPMLYTLHWRSSRVFCSIGKNKMANPDIEEQFIENRLDVTFNTLAQLNKFLDAPRVTEVRIRAVCKGVMFYDSKPLLVHREDIMFGPISKGDHWQSSSTATAPPSAPKVRSPRKSLSV